MTASNGSSTSRRRGIEDRRAVLDRLKVEFAVEKPSQKLQDVAALDAAALAAEVKKARGKKWPLSVAQVSLQEEHARSVGRCKRWPRKRRGWSGASRNWYTRPTA